MAEKPQDSAVYRASAVFSKISGSRPSCLAELATAAGLAPAMRAAGGSADRAPTPLRGATRGPEIAPAPHDWGLAPKFPRRPSLTEGEGGAGPAKQPPPQGGRGYRFVQSIWNERGEFAPPPTFCTVVFDGMLFAVDFSGDDDARRAWRTRPQIARANGVPEDVQ